MRIENASVRHEVSDGHHDVSVFDNRVDVFRMGNFYREAPLNLFEAHYGFFGAAKIASMPPCLSINDQPIDCQPNTPCDVVCDSVIPGEIKHPKKKQTQEVFV